METFPIFMDWILLKWLLKWSKESVQSYWNPNKVFTEIEKPILKFIQNLRWLWIIKTILKKRNEVVEFLLLDFKTYSKAIVIKALIKAKGHFRPME